MGGDQHGDAVLVEVMKQIKDGVRQLHVEIAGGLVGQQQWRPVYHGARDADALLFAARQHDREEFLLVQQPDHFECGAHAFWNFAMCDPAGHQRQGHVVEHGVIAE